MKLRQINAYRTEDVPDHLLHEITELGKEFMNAIAPLLDNVHPNKSLSAINFVLAAVTKTLVSDDISEQRKAALVQARGIIGNVAMLNGMSIDEFMKESEP